MVTIDLKSVGQNDRAHMVIFTAHKVHNPVKLASRMGAYGNGIKFEVNLIDNDWPLPHVRVCSSVTFMI